MWIGELSGQQQTDEGETVCPGFSLYNNRWICLWLWVTCCCSLWHDGAGMTRQQRNSDDTAEWNDSATMFSPLAESCRKGHQVSAIEQALLFPSGETDVDSDEWMKNDPSNKITCWAVLSGRTSNQYESTWKKWSLFSIVAVSLFWCFCVQLWYSLLLQHSLFFSQFSLWSVIWRWNRKKIKERTDQQNFCQYQEQTNKKNLPPKS